MILPKNLYKNQPGWQLPCECATKTERKMEPKRNISANPFNEACWQILTEHPAAIGVAYKVLDCGCSLLCGISVTGDPLGALRHIPGHPERKGAKTPICLRCKMDNGLKRVVWEGIYWPGSESEQPDKAFRISIGRKVFGTGYLEPD